jgi:biopolymer transport protein ExbD
MGILFLLLATGLYVGPIHWAETRIFVPVDMPISLKPGHIRTGEFKINLNSNYEIGIRFDESNYKGFINCDVYRRIKAHWTIFPHNSTHGARPPIEGHFGDDYPGSDVDLSPGTYDLDLQISPGADCLDRVSPRLFVETDKYEYTDLFQGICLIFLVLAGTGSVLLILPALRFLRNRFVRISHEKLCIFTSPGYVYRPSFKRPRPMPIFFRVVDFGLVYTVTMLPVFFLWVFIVVHIWGDRKVGILVPISIPGGPFLRVDPHENEFLVGLDMHGNYFVNSRQVPRDHLQQYIQQELANRAEWTVYFEADPNSRFSDAAFAMDAIRAAHGKLVWLTPGARSQIASPDR